MPAISPSTRANRWRGPQPVRAQAEPEASRAEKNACETNGLKRDIELAPESFEDSVSKPSSPSGGEIGWAQASQSSAATWLTDATASKVISDESIDDLNRSRVTISHSTGDAHGDAHGDRCKDRALRGGLQGCAADFKFPAETLQRSSDRRSGQPARAVQACARSRSTAAGRKYCA